MGIFQSTRYKKEREYLRQHSVDEKDLNVNCWKPSQIARLRPLMEVGKVYTEVDDAEDDDSVKIDPVSFDDAFEAFTAAYSQWDASDESTCALFFAQYPKIKNLKVMRKQKSGLCYMHAPVVLQHYLVSIFNGASSDLGVIDIAQYISKHWKGSILVDYLLRDSCGNSMDFMKEINHHILDFSLTSFTLPHKSKLLGIICDDIMNRLKTHPALVSNFLVDEAFCTTGISFLDKNIDTQKKPGKHAMLLLGCRKCSTHGFVFLLQNWWDGRYFIEVSANYMALSAATISFVDNEITKIPETFPVVYSKFSETTVDVSERMDEI